MAKWLSPLIIALPAALLGELLGWPPLWIFALALVALVPLAGTIGHYTGRLTEYVGDVAGGLLDATFGNAPEIIIGALLIAGVFHVVDALDIVRALIIGSVVSNALFVLGSSIFVGALRNGRMTFSADRAGGYASMLALAVAGLALPALAVLVGNINVEGSLVKLTSVADQVHLSVVVAVILLISYAAYLAATIFHFGERAHPPRKKGKPETPAQAAEEEAKAERDAELGIPTLEGDHPGVPETEVERLVEAEEDDAAREVRQLREKRRGNGRRIIGSLIMVLIATALTVLASAVLVQQMNTVIVNTALTPFFVGFILLPIITNVVEQLGSISSALDNRMEETMAIAAGSSVQMVLLVGPLLVLFSVALGQAHPLTMVFSKLELIIVTLVTFVYALISLDGETTWLEGLQLVAFYAMVGAMAFFLPGA